jgi:hypothetical protein
MADDRRHGQLYDKGLAVRREVLGAEYVESFRFAAEVLKEEGAKKR